MTAALSPAAARVQTAVTARGFDFAVQELPVSTRTAEAAAAAIGCDVAQIVKSLVFRRRASDLPLLVLASGANQVDLHTLARLAGEPVVKADADFVRAATGFAIGGIPPIGHPRRLRTIIDRDLLAWPTVWAAAGTPHAVFALPGSALAALTEGEVEDVRSA